jgi:4-amino-4-deoxy-L-arabinose transferase-like glycosyltransferase
MTWFFGNRKSLILALALAFILAIGIRFYDLTDLPLDFSPTRQLYSALKARGMYYAMLPAGSGITEWQREMAITQWNSIPPIEPTVLETITALTYRVAGEHLWIARIYSSMFWVLAGILLFLLACELSGPSGAFIALLFYLFLPYGVIASRAFQPDPLMVALIVAGIWATFRWANTRTWKWAITAGILNGLAIFVKNVAVFPLVFAAAAMVLDYGLIKSIKDKQTWAMALLAALPTAIYTFYGVKVAGYLGGQFAFRFFPQLWPQPAFYLQWLGQIDGVTGFSTFVLAVTGIFVARQRGMRLLAGLWLGYFAYGMTFAYHITTHDYYQIPLIPIVALSLSPVAETLFEQANKLRAASDSGTSSPGSQGLNRYGSLIIRVTLALLITLVTAIQIWNVRVELIRDNWRPDAEFWAMLGEKLGHNDPVLAIAQDYGYRLAYWGWEKVDSWYDSGDLALRALDGRQVNLLQRFQQQVVGKHFLVVTQSNRFDQQPEIKAYVYKTYPIFDEGKGYIIFDLTKQIPTK